MVAKTEPAERPDKSEKDKKQSRKITKSRVSDIKSAESTPKMPRKSAVKPEIPTMLRIPIKRMANGSVKHKAFSADKEKTIRDIMDQFDYESIDETEFEDELLAWMERAKRRRQEMNRRDFIHRQSRRSDFAETEALKLQIHANLGKARYSDLHYDEALQEVREQELWAEKERKKDMQRKRRREKSMAATLEQQAAALQKASQAEDEAERLK